MKKVASLFLSVIMMFSAAFAAPSTLMAASKPKATSITKITSNVKGFTVKWKKVKCSGYQIQYSTNKKFKNSKKINVSSSKSSRKISKLKAKKKYYVRIRTKKGKKYSSWSKTKSINTKSPARRSSRSSSKKSSGTEKDDTKSGTTVYITPTGKKYHYDASCAGVNAIKTTISEARSEGYEPCKKCAV